MKIEKKRLNELVQWIAIKYYGLAAEKKTAASHTETIINIVGDTLQSNNGLLNMTFMEAILLITDHVDEIMVRLIDLAHHHNPSHECKSCVLMYLCEPSEEDQKDHKHAKDGVDGLIEFLEMLDELGEPEDGQDIALPEQTDTSKEDMDEQILSAADILIKLLQNKKQ